jgi:hypothetical protein
MYRKKRSRNQNFLISSHNTKSKSKTNTEQNTTTAELLHGHKMILRD